MVSIKNTVKKLGESNDDKRSEDGQNEDWLENTSVWGNFSSEGIVSNDDVHTEVKFVKKREAFRACNKKKMSHTSSTLRVQYTFHRRKSK